MDILGFKSMTEKAEKEGQSQNFLDQLYGPLKTARECLEDTNLLLNELTQKDEFVLRAFTDNVFMGYPLQTSATSSVGSVLRRALSKASAFQLDMAINGFFIRGAVALNEAFIDEIVVTGPALMEAYSAEQVDADYPRVILTSTAYDEVTRYGTSHPKPQDNQLSDYLRLDVDGRQFVNYLTAGLLDANLVARHRDAVIAKLKEFQADSKILKKYQWVAQYHNNFCAEHVEQFGHLRLSPPASD